MGVAQGRPDTSRMPFDERPRPRRASSDRVHEAARRVSMAALEFEAESRRRIGSVDSVPATVGALEQTLHSVTLATETLALHSARAQPDDAAEAFRTLLGALRDATALCGAIRRSPPHSEAGGATWPARGGLEPAAMRNGFAPQAERTTSGMSARRSDPEQGGAHEA